VTTSTHRRGRSPRTFAPLSWGRFLLSGLLLPGLAIPSVGGCAVDSVDGGEGPRGGKEDAWDSRNDPARFDGQFNYHIEDLPLEGRAEREAWPSTYWPTYDDSINHRWIPDTLSPAEKYDRAFNGWEPSADFMGLRPFSRNTPTPTEDWDPDYYDQLGPLAGHISGQMGNARDRQAAIAAGGRPTGEWDVETWWGLCHAWVPAAMLEARPERAVTHNGVTFEVGDLEALLIAAYNRADADMIGGRCNLGNDSNEPIERDEYGRAVAVECRDTNAGSFHVIMTNYLGLMQRAYAEDRTYDYEVWNQPVVAYEVTKLEKISVEEAHELLRAEGMTDTYLFNPDAASLYNVNARTTYITESHASRTPADARDYERDDSYSYILEVDAEGKIIGGEWYGSSRMNLPDFLWNPKTIRASAVPYLDIDNVRMLVEMSREPMEPEEPGEVVEIEGEGGLAIPDNDPDGVASVAHADTDIVVGTLQLEVAISHTYVGDLTVSLRHGDIERVVHNREGAAQDDLRETFAVAGFEGMPAEGEWVVQVVDAASYDSGTLDGWKLRIAP
jgi:hypothetical protein